MSRHFRIGLCCSVALVALSAALPRSSVAALENTQQYVNDAKARIAKGDLRGAEIQLRNAVQANPSDPSLHVELAQLYIDMNNLPAAEAEARLARQYKGPPDEVDPLLAQALLRQGKLTELFRDVQPANRAPKVESQVRLTLGLGHLALRETNEAEPLIKAAETLDPSAALPKAAMVEPLLARGDIADAQNQVAAAMAIAPDDPTVLRDSALVLLAQGNTGGALNTLNKVISVHPDDIATLGLRANILMGENKLEQAQTDLDHALKLAPRSAGLVYIHALLLARQNKWHDADTQLSSIETEFNDIPSAYYLQGVTKYQLGAYQEAATDLSKYLARVPNNKQATLLLAQIFMRQRDYSSAIDELKPVVDSDPSDAGATTLLAQAYLATGQRSDALALYQRLAELHPKDVGAAVNLDVMKINVGEVQQGLDELDKMAQSAEGSTAAGPALVISDLRLGHVSDADQAAQQLLVRDSHNLLAQSLLGTVRMEEGKYAEAATIFKAIVDKDRTLLGAQRGLARADVALGKLDDAKAAMQALVQQNPGSIPDEVYLAGIEARQKDVAAAADLLRKAQQGAAADPTPGLALLEIYGEEKAWDQAQSYARTLELQFPGNPRVITAIAGLRAAAGDAKGAAAEYAELSQAMPNDPGVALRYAAYETQAGDQTGARATLENALSADPKNYALMSSLANFDFDHGGLDKALTTAKSFAPDQQLASDLISAGLYERAKRLQDAVAVLTAAMKRNPQLSVALELANDLYGAGEKSQAVSTLLSWTKDHPGDFDAEILLGQFYDGQSDLSGAQQAYEAAYKLRPGNWVVANNLAEIYAGKGDARSRALAEQAYYIEPGPPTADTYGWALVRTGAAPEGLPLLRKAAAALPDNVVVLYHLAVALKETGNRDEARTILQKVVASGAAFDDENAAKQLLNQLQRG